MKKGKIKIKMGIIFILALGYVFGAYKINTQFKQVKLEEISFGTEHEVISGVQMKVNGFSRMDKEELYRNYGYKMDYDGEIKAFFVPVTYSNESEKAQMVATYNNNIERVGYSNGIDPLLYNMCNTCGLEFELEKGEKKNIILTYILLDFQFTDKKWNKINEEDFVITTSRYPIKTDWLLR